MTGHNLTAERLRQVLLYNPETGVFVSQIRRNSFKGLPGDVAGSKAQNGYVSIKIDGKKHSAHRLAWLYVYGTWPIGHIDHRNRVRDDNRIDNLRDVSRATNRQNVEGPQKNNTVGYLGVTRMRSKFQSQISADGETVHLGTFDTPELASVAYESARKRLHAAALA